MRRLILNIGGQDLDIRVFVVRNCSTRKISLHAPVGVTGISKEPTELQLGTAEKPRRKVKAYIILTLGMLNRHSGARWCLWKLKARWSTHGMLGGYREKRTVG